MRYSKQKIEIEVDVPDGKKAVWKNGKVVFEDVLPKLPRLWVQFCKDYPITSDECYINVTCEIIQSCSNKETSRAFISDANWLPSERAAKQHLALMQLHQLRDCYRQGWICDWDDGEQTKYIIEHYLDGYHVSFSHDAPYFLAFQSEEIAEEFLNNFRDLIEQAGDLI